NYQSGMFMDAVIASGTPGAVATTGPAGIIGRTYGDIVQDMVDYYAWSQNDSGAEIGGWIYNPSNNSGQSTDNSTAGWVAIGIAAAEDVFGSTVPQWVKDRNEIALEATDNESDTSDRDGIIGYQSSSEIWGPYSTTGAGMIQMSMDGILSTSSATPDERWIRSENFFRRHYNDAASGNNLKNYYYAMFNLAKALRTAKPGPVVVIGANDSVGCGPSPSCAGGVAPLDWYNDPSVGMARVVVDYQVTTGVNIGGFTDRPGNSHGSNQDDHNTPWATQILTRTLFQPGPTAVATATPNPAASGTPIEFDGTASFHDDPDRSIVQWDWDFDEDGVTDASGPVVVNAFPCPNLPCVYPVTLTVTDDNDVPLTAQAIVEVEITIPPHPPTADAGGPYLVCTGEDLNLDGSGSFDIDEGLSETGDPPFDTITAWDWELDGVSPFDFDEATGETVVYVTNDPFSGLIGLQVTDNTAAAFPTSGQPDLTGRDFTTLNVVECGCLQNFFARGKADTNGAAVNLVWPPVDDATSYDVFRSTEGPNTGFQLLKAGHVTTRATYFDKIAPPLAANYWYRVAVNGVEGCGGSVAAQASIGNRTLPRR
ncbi:MAG: PKD domain-containing protein, partial [Pseudomonadota bacterium]